MIKNKYAVYKKLPLIRIPYTQLKELCYDDLNPDTSKFVYNDGYCSKELEY